MRAEHAQDAAATHEQFRRVQGQLSERESASDALSSLLRERDAQALETNRLLVQARREAEEREA